MTIARRMIGIILALICLGLLVISLRALFFIGFQTGDIVAQLYNPVFALPMIGASLGLLGGIIAAVRYPFGGGMGVVAGAIYLFFGVSVYLLGGGKEMAFPKLVFGMMIMLCSLAILRLPRHLDD